MKSGLSFLIAALRCEIEGLEQLTRTGQLVGSIGRLVHALQRERGISNVWLASGGQRFAAQRSEQIAESMNMETAARESFDLLQTDSARIGNGARLFSRIAWVLPGLDGLPELRRRIGCLELDAAASTTAYTKLLSGLLAVVFEAADGATDPEVSRVLVALFNFMQGKEFAGQERACGAAAFASGRNDSSRQQQWLHLIDSQERCFQLFIEFSAETVADLWRTTQSPEQIAEQERLRRIACAAPPGVMLDPDLSRTWFDCCTRRIDAMHWVEERLAADLQRICKDKTAKAHSELRAHEALLPRVTESADPMAAAFFEEPVWSQSPGSAPLYGRQLERSILDMVQEQSHRLQAMSDELETVRAALNERKLVERAKGLLMARRGISEQEAHKMLRHTAMNQSRRLIEVAESVLSLAEFLPRDVAS